LNTIKQNTGDTTQDLPRLKDINNNFDELSSDITDANTAISNEVTRATNAEATKANLALDNITLASALTKFGFAGQSLTQNGYYKFPNGLIIQWGQTVSFDSTTIAVFPIPFPTACLNIQATQISGYGQTIGVSSWNATSFTATKTTITGSVQVGTSMGTFQGNFSSSTLTGSVSYIAIGY